MREKILIIRLKSIGDVLFTLPAVHAIRQNFPLAELHFLTSQEHASLLRGFAEIDRVIPLDRAVFRSGKIFSAAANLVRLLRRLRREKFSIAIDLQGFGETELLSWLSGAPERWGHIYQSGRGWAYTRGFSAEEKIHPGEWHLQLLKKCGLKIGEVRNEFILPPDALAQAQKIFADNRLDLKKPTLFLQPFTSANFKNWPLENYLTLARHFQTRGVQIIFGGGAADRAKLERVAQEKFVVVIGEPLLVVAGLLQLSTLVIGGDTGVLHLAVALRRRVLMLMISYARIYTHPFQHPDWTIRALKRSPLATVETSTVIAATEKILGDLA